MKDENFCICDANEATADVAYRLSEVVAIYPITPSSPMAEHCDEWAAKGKKNLWGVVPLVSEMQSEGGAAGAIHGALQAGTLATTFTASQGLLLMIPNMYKIAGELSPLVMHVTARSLATHGLSIFGDHSDVMACRQTGFAMLASNSVQEAHDMACISHAATLESRIPFMHFFDGFRTSHEVNTFSRVGDEILLQLVDGKFIAEHRSRSLSPDNPFIRGTAQNPDVYFQGRERSNEFYGRTASIVEKYMHAFGNFTGRHYKPFDYFGSEDAERIVISMGSSCETLAKVVEHLVKNGEKVGLVKVRLFRPFSVKHLLEVLPKSVNRIAILDRTKEPGSIGEPLFEDVVAAIDEGKSSGLIAPGREFTVIGGRYGLGSKEFSPPMAKAVFDELQKNSPKKHFTVGIDDDVSYSSIPWDSAFKLEAEDLFEAVFFGLGSDGTVGANKNTIKIIGSETGNHAQAYFVYDSKKSGAITVSHLRFGPNPIEAPYLIEQANFVACHQYSFLNKYDILKYARPGGIFLLNAPHDTETLWQHLPREAQSDIQRLKLEVYAIDAYDVARKAGMGGRTNTVMQTCFFVISGILPREEAIAKIKNAIQKTYGAKGESVVQKNFAAVEATLEHLHKVDVSGPINGHSRPPIVSPEAPDFVRNVTAKMLFNGGDDLPVSAFPPDGTWPSGTTQWEKRNIAQEIPIWNPEICIQCNKCATVCPHAAIRAKFYSTDLLNGSPESFRSKDFRSQEHPGCKFSIQVAPEDCTGCGLCIEACPARDKTDESKKALNFAPQESVVEREKKNYAFFLSLPDPDPVSLGTDMKSMQFKRPLFEYSSACAGCGETPYLKLLTQIFGDRLLIANATGCSSIYGGNLPTTPYCTNADGRGPAWANSLFEDNAEFGLGMRVAINQKANICRNLLLSMKDKIGERLVEEILSAKQNSELEIAQQRDRIEQLRRILKGIGSDESTILQQLLDSLVKKSVWIVGGDGWAYDIGYGGLDHVLASGENVNVLVLDTEVYSNTGGQQSKSTPIGAVAKFAAAGKAMPKKNLGLLAITYGNIYVAQVSMGAKDTQVVPAFRDAESYEGPSLLIAYSPCIAHGYNLRDNLEQQKKAVASGYWPLFRYDPRRRGTGKSSFILDSKDPTLPLLEYVKAESRFHTLMDKDPQRANDLLKKEEDHIKSRHEFYKMLATNENL
ncbi:MAG: pyruvate:ferredoxin (flavodoxin) oxidoreductase [Puniceicoccales bacterium]|jgi:pyruvate-ferredoxin/flavodoxin oxidoreductase|nr:pyruvate:ferredoxin (flavodoxin) oxidoreductase [Puniceicoccales bacterium]